MQDNRSIELHIVDDLGVQLLLIVGLVVPFSLDGKLASELTEDDGGLIVQENRAVAQLQVVLELAHLYDQLAGVRNLSEKWDADAVFGKSVRRGVPWYNV